MLQLPIWRHTCFFSYRRFTSGLKYRSLEVEPGPYSLPPGTQLETELRLFLCKLEKDVEKELQIQESIQTVLCKEKAVLHHCVIFQKMKTKGGPYIQSCTRKRSVHTLPPVLFPETVSLCCLGWSHFHGDSPAKASKRWHDRYVPLHPAARPFSAKMAEQVYTKAASPLSQQWSQGACDPMAHAHLINGTLLTIVIYLNIYWFSRQSFSV